METQQPNFTIPHPTPWQQAFLQKEDELQPRLIAICLGRRGGKSFIALLWVLLNRLGLLAGHSCAWVSPSDKILGEVKSWVRSWLDPFIIGPSPGGLGYRLQNGADVDFWSGSPGSTQPLRSRGYSCCVIDEAAHYKISLRDTVDAAIRPALALAEGKLMFISTPEGLGDFHHFYTEAQRTGFALHGSSLVNPHFSEAEYKRLQRVTEPIRFRTEYGAEFLESSGALLRREQIRYGVPPPLEEFRTIVFGLDLALSTKQRSDYSAVVVAGVDKADRRWILHALRWRSDWPTTFARVLSLNETWQPRLIQTEQVSFQELAIRSMLEAGLPVTTICPHTDKEARFSPVHQQYALGYVWHNELLDVEFEHELLSFPMSDHDDWVDATGFALLTLFKNFRAALSADQGSGAVWGSGGSLAHEKPRSTFLGYDIWGQPHMSTPSSDEGDQDSAPNPAGEAAPVVVHPSFSERFVGDTLIVTAADGRELMRIERGKSHLYFGQKRLGQLPWQQKA